jgi:ATP-dependent helicase/nuclease subunit A
VPRYLVGNLVHQALADWSLLSQGERGLQEGLTAIARSLGVQQPAQAEDAARRARRLLNSLIRSPLYKQIDQARTRLHEIPFTLHTGSELLHGAVDLLFEDDQGWHLLDWKSEWIPPGEAGTKAQEFLPQLATYRLAVTRILGLHPQTGVCLLADNGTVHWFSEDDLAQALTTLNIHIHENPHP